MEIYICNYKAVNKKTLIEYTSNFPRTHHTGGGGGSLLCDEYQIKQLNQKEFKNVISGSCCSPVNSSQVVEELQCMYVPTNFT